MTYDSGQGSSRGVGERKETYAERQGKLFGFSWSMTTETVRTHLACSLKNSATKCM